MFLKWLLMASQGRGAEAFFVFYNTDIITISDWNALSCSKTQEMVDMGVLFGQNDRSSPF